MTDDELAPRSPQQRAADRLAELLSATAGEVAARTPRQPVTAATPERVDAVKLLAKLSQRLPEFCRRAILGQVENDEWEVMSTVLVHAARACREQIVIDADTADSDDDTDQHGDTDRATP